MLILVGCEESQAVCKAFRELGHEAYSCDLQSCSGEKPEWHIQDDVLNVIKGGAFTVANGYSFQDEIIVYKWDLIILHPECTKLAVSGNRWYGEGTPGFDQRLQAVEWTQNLWDTATSLCDHVCMENPVGVLNKYGTFPKPQYIQPWQFGHGETKRTGLWLHGLPELKPTCIVEGREQKVWKMPPSKDRAKLRSKTYSGIAKSMATQWSEYIQNIIYAET